MVTLNANSPKYDANYSTLDQYGKYHFKGTFSWDMRVGVDFRVGSALPSDAEVGRLYVNVDIINILNAKNMTTYGLSNVLGSVRTSAARYDRAVPVYEIGRQFWLQIGYKY